VRIVPDASPSTLNPTQVSCLERLLKAGYQFITFEQFARYPAVEKDRFVALLDISRGRVQMFGTIGYHLGSGIGVLLERSGVKSFVWKNESLAATPELLAAYESVKSELDDLLRENVEQ
jgi:hypothetical protein